LPRRRRDPLLGPELVGLDLDLDLADPIQRPDGFLSILEISK